jgi:four helix bundle protein
MKNYRDLDVWQRAIDLVVFSYELTRTFPQEEIYGICSQIRRAAVSIPANIAEGQSKQYSR